MVDGFINTWVLMEDDKAIGLISIKHNSIFSDVLRLILNKKENLKVYRFLIKAMIEKAIVFISNFMNSIDQEFSSPPNSVMPLLWR